MVFLPFVGTDKARSVVLHMVTFVPILCRIQAEVHKTVMDLLHGTALRSRLTVGAGGAGASATASTMRTKTHVCTPVLAA